MIADFFAGKTVFMTGSTGFLGRWLLEKILSDLPVARVYCLVRSAPTVHTAHPKVCYVRGDVTQPRLGLSADDVARVCESSSIIIHLAAYTKWNVSLPEQVRLDTYDMLECMEIARRCSRLERVVFPTTFGACLVNEDPIAAEIVHSFDEAAPDDELADLLDDNNVAYWGALAERYYPNFYCYAKALGERVLAERYPEYPIHIARISSACAAWREPYLGWGDSCTALPNLYRAIMRGSGYTMPWYRGGQNILDNIPVDVVMNLLICNLALDDDSFRVYHGGGASLRHPTTFEDCYLPAMDFLATYVDADTWYHAGRDIQDCDEFCDHLEHAGQSPPGGARGLYWARALAHGYDRYLRRSLILDDREARRPLARMSADERRRFAMDVEDIDWGPYFFAMAREAYRRASGVEIGPGLPSYDERRRAVRVGAALAA